MWGRSSGAVPLPLVQSDESRTARAESPVPSGSRPKPGPMSTSGKQPVTMLNDRVP